MTENEFNRLTRWGIPGWITILSFIMFVVIDILFSKGQTRLYDSVSALFQSMNEVTSIAAGLFITAAGVPFGFAIYQSYFFLRWNSPFARDGLAPPFIVGRNEDLDRTIRDITLDELAQHKPWRENWVKHPLYFRDHGWRWRYLELTLYEAIQKIDTRYKGSSNYFRNRYLLELMHTLGASLIGVYFGMIFYLFLKVYREKIILPWHMVGLIFPLVFLIYLLDREDKAKKDLEKPYDDRNDAAIVDPVPTFLFRKWLAFGPRNKIHLVHPSSIFLVVIGFVHLFCNPILDTHDSYYLDLLGKFVISIVAIAAWGRSKKRCPEEVRWGEIFVLLLLLALAILISFSLKSFTLSLDWPFFSSVYVFLVANLVLLKNRQNARDDLISLHYYTLRRYLTEKQHQEKVSESPTSEDNTQSS